MPEQQQQEQQQNNGAFDWSPAIGKLTPENLEFGTRKGWIKDGKVADGFDLNAAFGSYHGLEKLQGKQTLEAPDLTNPENFAKWSGHKLLGVPEKMEDYKFDRPKLPDGMPYDEAGEKMLRTALMKGHIGQSQAQAIYKDILAARIAEVTDAAKARQTEAVELDAQLKKDWGTDYTVKRESGKQALAFMAEKIGMKPEALADETAKAMGSAVTLRLFAQIATMLGEDTLKGGDGDRRFVAGAEAAKQEIAQLNMNKDFQDALLNKNHPQHKAVAERWTSLNRIALGG